MRRTEINAMSKTLKMKRNRQKYKCTSLPWWNFALQFLLNYSLGVVRENKFSYERVEEHHDFILPNDTIGCLWFTYSATHPLIWCLLFLPKKTLRKKIIAFFSLKSSVQFLKHCYSLPANRKLTSFKIIESKLRDHHLLCGSKPCLVFKLSSASPS